MLRALTAVIRVAPVILLRLDWTMAGFVARIPIGGGRELGMKMMRLTGPLA